MISNSILGEDVKRSRADYEAQLDSALSEIRAIRRDIVQPP
jgi:hypothetical protein